MIFNYNGNGGGGGGNSNMYYDQAENKIFVVDKNGVSHEVHKDVISTAKYLFKGGDGLLCSYTINGTGLIVEDTIQRLNIQQNAGGTTARMIFSKSLSEYVGHGKRLYIKAKATTNDNVTVTLGSNASYAKPTTASNTATMTVTPSEETYSFDIDSMFTASLKYLVWACASSYNGKVVSISDMYVK